MDSTTPYAPWSEAIEMVAKHPGAVDAALHSYIAWRLDSARAQVATRARRDSAEIVTYWHFLARHADRREYATARRMMLGDRDFRNRAVALTILANFIDRDSTLYAVLDAVREEDGIVRSLAGVELDGFVHDAPRLVDWGPATSSIHAVLDGTAIFELPVVMRLLLATKADTSIARPLLQGGGAMVVAFAAARHPAVKGDARRLLIALAGRDLGDNPAAWREWIDRM